MDKEKEMINDRNKEKKRKCKPKVFTADYLGSTV